VLFSVFLLLFFLILALPYLFFFALLNYLDFFFFVGELKAKDFDFDLLFNDETYDYFPMNEYAYFFLFSSNFFCDLDL